MTTKPKLLVVAGDDVAMRLATFTHLRSVGFDVAIAAPGMHQTLTKAGFPVFHYDLIRNVQPLADLYAIHQLRKIVLEWVPQIIHAYDTKPCYLVPIAMINIKGPKVIRTINGMGKIYTSDSLKNYILRAIYKSLHLLARRRIDYTIFQNSTDQNYFVDNNFVSRQKTSLIQGSGIDINYMKRFKSKPKRDVLRSELNLGRKTTFIMIARITKEKGVLDFLEAARQIRKRLPKTAFLLVGPAAGDEPDGIDTAYINSYAKDVTYLGRRDDIPQLLNASDIFVLPTKYREGVPRAMLEAMAMALPVIVSGAPGCQEAVQGRGTGILTLATGSKALAAAMKQVLNSDLSAMGKAGQSDIKNIYALPIVMKALTNIYGKFYDPQRL
jgi:glycosyltransferase involved in cell wall biosynthesis